ncbi:MAG: class I SAM-dependent methyltransferase [Myxococcales bacterium]|nr:class I SAM-dependent methyltransferase [Myxococcales bacterium]MBK7191776.1 class I SAM-dependent methyltransferase [Myxococcales bacterium]MBP6844070.1 class I SAM-dependent methyltransferase [Kofleriaceae bacterium]
MSVIGRAWDRRVLPWLVEKACRSTTILAERKRWVPQAAGEVLELGVGSGLNLAFYDPAQARAVVGIDPSPELLVQARSRAEAAAVPVELVEAAAERLPFDADRFDSALVSYTLCSVADPAAALAEVRRVLRPGAPLYFVEHGRSDRPRVRAWQARVTPVWRRIGGNCHLDRDIAQLLRDAGFALTTLEEGHVEGGGRLTSYTYQGVAISP